MSFKDITVGKKTGKAIAMRAIESMAKGSEGFEVAFTFEEPSTGTRETMHNVYWMTPDAIVNALKRLKEVLGYNGSVEIDAEGRFIDPNVLDFSREVELDIQEEVNDGKTRLKIAWVNAIGGGGFAALKPETIKSRLDKRGFREKWAELSKLSVVNHAPGAQKMVLPW